MVDSTSVYLRDNNIDRVQKVGNLDERTNNRIVRLGKYKKSFKELKGFVGRYVYENTMTAIMDTKAKKFIGEIYESYFKNPKQLPGDVYKSYIDASEACDAVGGNTGTRYDTNDGYRDTPARCFVII